MKQLNNLQYLYVPSESEKHKYYRVYLDSRGNIRCNCPSFIFRNICKHIIKYGNKLRDEKNGEVIKLDR